MILNSNYFYLGVFLSLASILSAQNLYINEVMSSNKSIISDEDGDFSDWIELFNAGVSPINLEGYGISDDSLDLKKWVFSNISLEPNEHFLLFASGKDRAGEISYWETVVREGDDWMYTPGASTIPADWSTVEFDDSSWSSGPSGFGYADNDDATIITNQISIFIRKKFVIEDTAAVVNAILHVDYDDAFVAYLNGQEIARSNIGTPGIPVSYDQFANGELGLDLKDAPEGFTLVGARVPAAQDKVHLNLTVPRLRTKEPVSLHLEGRATIQGRTVSHAAVPAEDMMQAFAYRHLVPSQELKVAVLKRSPPKPSGKKKVKPPKKADKK